MNFTSLTPLLTPTCHVWRVGRCDPKITQISIHILVRIYPLVICYIAMENGPVIVDLPMKNGDFQ